MAKFELTFWGAAMRPKFPRYRRLHATAEAAQEAAYRVLSTLDDRDIPRAAHPAIIYGPGCGSSGRTLA